MTSRLLASFGAALVHASSSSAVGRSRVALPAATAWISRTSLDGEANPRESSFRDPRWANIGISTHLSSRCASSSTRTHPSSDAVGTGESKARTNASASSSGQAKGVSDRWSHRRTELRKRWDAEIKKAHEEGKSQEELEEMAAMMKKEEKDLLADRWARTEDVAAFFIASQEQCGMTTEWDEVGRAVPLTVLWFDDNQVVQVRTPSRDGYAALQIGAGAKRAHRANWARRNHCVAHGVPVKARLKEFRVSPDALLPPGTRLHAGHFKAGQYVAVQGTTLGKGFQGGMKRHGFKGQPASHGVSLTHRSIGSTGQRKSPGRTFKGKKMPGQMGCETRTVGGVWVYRVDPERNLMWVRGQVPGHAGNWVFVSDDRERLSRSDPAMEGLPFPTRVEAGEVETAKTDRPRRPGEPLSV